MLPASLAADVPVFIATPTSAWASAGASLVPSPVIATSLPPACSFLISAILSSGVASARKSSTPASSAMALAVSGLSPVIITVRMPIRRISSNRSRMPCLTTSLRWMTPSTDAVPSTTSSDHQGVPPAAEMPSTMSPSSVDTRPPWVRTHSATELAAPLRSLCPLFEVDAGHPCRRAELDPVRLVEFAGRACPQPVLLLGEHHDRAAFRRLVGEAGQLRGVGQRFRRHTRQRHERRGLPVAQRDGAGLVQQQRVHVAGRLHGAARHGQHVALHQPVHAGDADGRQQRADRRRDQADQQRDHHDAGDAVWRQRQGVRDAGVVQLREDRQRLQCRHGEHEDDRQRGEQDVQRDLVRASSAGWRPRRARSSGR